MQQALLAQVEHQQVHLTLQQVALAVVVLVRVTLTEQTELLILAVVVVQHQAQLAQKLQVQAVQVLSLFGTRFKEK